MAGVPAAISDGPWWWLFLFLLGVVFLRAQATYWLGRGLRAGATGKLAGPASDAPPADGRVDESADAPSASGRRARMAARFSGPAWDRAQAFVERWGFVGIPLSFLTVGFQTLVNAAAGFARMRWDLYTLAMIPGCLAWAAVYSAVGFSLVAAWQASPWLFAGVVALMIVLAWGFTRMRRGRRAAVDG